MEAEWNAQDHDAEPGLMLSVEGELRVEGADGEAIRLHGEGSRVHVHVKDMRGGFRLSPGRLWKRRRELRSLVSRMQETGLSVTIYREGKLVAEVGPAVRGNLAGRLVGPGVAIHGLL